MMRLDELGKVIQGNSPPSSTYCESHEGTPLIQGPGDFGIDEAFVKKWTTTPTRIVPKGTILISVRAGVGRVNFAPCECTIGRGVAALIIEDEYDSQYVRWAIEATSHHLEKLAIGSTITGITGKQLKSHQIPIIEYDEQLKVGRNTNHQILELRRFNNLTKSSENELKLFRSSILKIACEGRLVPTEAELARQEGYDYEPAEKLLQRILAERRVRFETDNPGKKYKEPVKPDKNRLPTIPEGWCWVTFDQIVINHDGKRIPLNSADRKLRQGDYPYYGASGVIDSIDDFLFDGEYLLIAEDGANLETRVKPIAFSASGQFWVNNHAHVVENCLGIELSYLMHFINGMNVSQYLSGSAQPKLTQRNLKKIPIALPPVKEQRRILEILHNSFDSINAVNTLLESNRISAEVLKRSILMELLNQINIQPTKGVI